MSCKFKEFLLKFYHPSIQGFETESLRLAHISNDYDSLVEGRSCQRRRFYSIMLCIFHVLIQIRYCILINIDSGSEIGHVLGGGLLITGVAGKNFYIIMILTSMAATISRIAFLYNEKKNQLEFMTDFRFLLPRNSSTLYSKIRMHLELKLTASSMKEFKRHIQFAYFTCHLAIGGVFTFLAFLFSICHLIAAISLNSGWYYVSYALWLIPETFYHWLFCSDDFATYAAGYIVMAYCKIRFCQLNHRIDLFKMSLNDPKTFNYHIKYRFSRIMKDYVDITCQIHKYDRMFKWIMIPIENFVPPGLTILFLALVHPSLEDQPMIRILIAFLWLQAFIITYLIILTAVQFYMDARRSYVKLASLSANPRLNKLIVVKKYVSRHPAN